MMMHHQHFLINHALMMAVKGANLILLGEMGMSRDTDNFSSENGGMMMKNARLLFADIMEEKVMHDLHDKG